MELTFSNPLFLIRVFVEGTTQLPGRYFLFTGLCRKQTQFSSFSNRQYPHKGVRRLFFNSNIFIRFQLWKTIGFHLEIVFYFREFPRTKSPSIKILLCYKTKLHLLISGHKSAIKHLKRHFISKFVLLYCQAKLFRLKKNKKRV